MSVIALTTVKQYLRVTHTSDDTLLQRLLNGAEQEALRILNRSELPTLPLDYPEDSSSEVDVTTESEVLEDVVTAVSMLVRIQYDALDPKDAKEWRGVAETILWPYRTEIGV